MKTSLSKAHSILGPELIQVFRETYKNEQEYQEIIDQAMRAFAFINDEGLSNDEQEYYQNEEQ